MKHFPPVRSSHSKAARTHLSLGERRSNDPYGLRLGAHALGRIPPAAPVLSSCLPPAETLKRSSTSFSLLLIIGLDLFIQQLAPPTECKNDRVNGNSPSVESPCPSEPVRSLVKRTFIHPSSSRPFEKASWMTLIFPQTIDNYVWFHNCM